MIMTRVVALFSVALAAATATRAQACLHFNLPAFPESTFHRLMDVLRDRDLGACDRDFFVSMLRRGTIAHQACADVDCVETVGLMFSGMETPAYRGAQWLGRQRGMGHRHQLVKVYVYDAFSPHMGNQIVIEDECWRHGRGGRSCRILNIRRASAEERLWRPEE